MFFIFISSTLKQNNPTKLFLSESQREAENKFIAARIAGQKMSLTPA